MSIFGKRNKKGELSVNLSYVDGVEAYSKGTAVSLSLNDTESCITMIARVYKKPPVNLKYEQITGVSVVSEKEVIEKSKSTVGRAVVGGVLLGPLGAIIGGMSGIGSKQQNKSRSFIVINYNSSDGDIKVLSCEIVGASLHWSTFITELKNRIKKQEVVSEINL